MPHTEPKSQRSCSVADVPPWRHLELEGAPEEAALAAARAHGIHDAASLVTLVWKFRQIARGADGYLGGD